MGAVIKLDIVAQQFSGFLHAISSCKSCIQIKCQPILHSPSRPPAFLFLILLPRAPPQVERYNFVYSHKRNRNKLLIYNIYFGYKFPPRRTHHPLCYLSSSCFPFRAMLSVVARSSNLRACELYRVHTSYQ